MRAEDVEEDLEPFPPAGGGILMDALDHLASDLGLLDEPVDQRQEHGLLGGKVEIEAGA